MKIVVSHTYINCRVSSTKERSTKTLMHQILYFGIAHLISLLQTIVCITFILQTIVYVSLEMRALRDKATDKTT